jgi:hypothetical protein
MPLRSYILLPIFAESSSTTIEMDGLIRYKQIDVLFLMQRYDGTEKTVISWQQHITVLQCKR